MKISYTTLKRDLNFNKILHKKQNVNSVLAVDIFFISHCG